MEAGRRRRTSRRGPRGADALRRRRIVQKPYDVDVEFVGNRRPNVLKRFWDLAEPRDRLASTRRCAAAAPCPDVHWSLSVAQKRGMTAMVITG